MARWEFRLGEHLLGLQARLAEERWMPGPYVRFEIHEPKRRTISAAPFADRIVHHALMQVSGPAFERNFSPRSFANRVGMGTHAAIAGASAGCARHAWALRLDVQQHFQSIDHALLLARLESRLPDERLRRVVRVILASGREEAAPRWLPGDELLDACRPRGLPVGNLTSQFWSNVYVDPLDKFITRQLRCRAYVRYVDDLVLFSDSWPELTAWGAEIRRFCLDRLRLQLHQGSDQPLPTAGGVPWLGMVLYPTHRLLKSRKVVAATRRLGQGWRDWQAGAIDFAQFDAQVQGWIAHARHADSWRIRDLVLSRLPLLPPTHTVEV